MSSNAQCDEKKTQPFFCDMPLHCRPVAILPLFCCPEQQAVLNAVGCRDGFGIFAETSKGF